MMREIRIRLSASVQRPLAFATARRMLREQDGAAAIEFAMVATPFLAMVFAIMETALVFFAGQTLENAVADSARLIMTGQAQTKGYDQKKFKDEICVRSKALLNCVDIQLDVKSYPSFANLDTSKPVDGNKLKTDGFDYKPGGPGDIVVVRVVYPWQIYVSLLGGLSDMAGNKRLLMTTVAFRNEPYL